MDGDPEALLRLREKSWFEPMDNQTIGDHMVTMVFQIGDGQIVVFVPLMPIVYLLPPTVWISGALGLCIHISRIHTIFIFKELH